MNATATVRCCPQCGLALDGPRGFIQEYWEASHRHFLCWCPACDLTTTVTLAERIEGHEVEE
jgi:hypothetical protein